MARILFGAASLTAHGGIADVARMTLRVLREAGHHVHAVSYLDEPGSVAQAACAGGSKVRFAALVHALAPRCDACFYDSAGIARAHPRAPFPRRPYGVWMHGIEAWEGARFDALRSFRRADLVLVNSRYTLARHRALHGDLAAARVCLLGTPSDNPAPEPAPGRPPLVLMVSRIDRLEAYKGHREMIAAWPDVVAVVPAARLAIVGGGSGLEGIRALASASSVAGAIEVHGFLDDDRLEPIWSQARVFAMPSRNEGFGLVYAEAMRRGLPVVTSVQDAGCEIIRDGETGFTVDPADTCSLSQRLSALLSDPALASRMGTAGQRDWAANYSYTEFRDRLRPLIGEFLE